MTEEQLAELDAAMPFTRTIGIRFTAASAEQVTARMPWREDLCTTGGMLHGGALMSLADSAGGACALLNLPAGAGTSTIESKTNFLRGVRDGYVEATARPLHVGRSVIVVETELLDASLRRVAKVLQSQIVLSAQ